MKIVCNTTVGAAQWDHGYGYQWEKYFFCFVTFSYSTKTPELELFEKDVFFTLWLFDGFTN